MNTATLKIPMDSAGRVVIPQEIRKHFGLRGGAQFKIVETKNTIVLEPLDENPKIKNKKGFLVVCPEGNQAPSDETEIINKIREERIYKLVHPS
ncbi:MAG: hypothetical protein A2048_10255 [Deltaproteobacteria bacterium GWA2_45_12]|nr:MAG: hypothetical protein A2048_10255 [Deltaproteobacteria bacterium GWA2_45_12]